MIPVETVCYHAESVRISERCGASRVELCANEGAGGTSPGLALLETVKEQCRIPVFVMVRPREGDFTYTREELLLIRREIEMYKKAGADGIVCAALHENGTVNREALKQLVDASTPLPFTFHRAFDHTPDPLRALDDIVACGCTRILTSGQKKSALDGRSLIRELIQRAGNELIILPGAGITAYNVQELIEETGCREVHLSARKIVQRHAHLNPEIQLGSAHDTNTWQCTDEAMLQEVLRITNEY